MEDKLLPRLWGVLDLKNEFSIDLSILEGISMFTCLGTCASASNF